MCVRLEYGIILAVLLVAFVPALTLIYSPPALQYAQTTTTQTVTITPTCPECSLPRIRPYFVWVTPHGDEVSVIMSFAYKYFVLVNVPQQYIVYAEYCTGEYDEEGFPICYILNFRALNSTHSYAFVDKMAGFSIELYGPVSQIQVDKVHAVVLVVPRDYTLEDVIKILG